MKKRIALSLAVGLVVAIVLILAVVALSQAGTFSTRWTSGEGAVHETRGIYWYIPQDDGQLTVIAATCDRSQRYIGGEPEDFVTDSCQIVFGR
jgi:hypothetical protein